MNLQKKASSLTFAIPLHVLSVTYFTFTNIEAMRQHSRFSTPCPIFTLIYQPSTISILRHRHHQRLISCNVTKSSAPSRPYPPTPARLPLRHDQDHKTAWSPGVVASGRLGLHPPAQLQPLVRTGGICLM